MWEQEKNLRKVPNMEKGLELSHGGVTEYSSDNTDVEVHITVAPQKSVTP
jgi:hypothetical protein